MGDVALVGPSWPFRGGIARTTTALARALEARGSLDLFLVPERQYGRVLYPGPADVDHDACPRLESAEARFAVLEPWTWPRAIRRVRSSRARAVVLPYWTFAWAPFDLTLQQQIEQPVIGIVHNPADHDAGALARVAARAVLSRCSAYLCHAQSVAAVLRERWPGKPLVVHPLPPPAVRPADQAQARRRLEVPEDAVAFLFFGLIRPYKGLDVLLEAFSRLPSSSRAVLLIAGEPWGDLARELPAKLEREGLRDRVIPRLEWIPEDDAATWFAAADAVVLPYLTATGSAVAAQALAHERPLIGSRVGGLAEVVESDVNGLLVPPSDVTALTAALERALDVGLRERLRGGVREAARRWTWDSYAATVTGLVSNLGAPAHSGGRR